MARYSPAVENKIAYQNRWQSLPLLSKSDTGDGDCQPRKLSLNRRKQRRGFYKVSLGRLPELNAASKCSREKGKAIRKVVPEKIGWFMSKLRRGYLESRSWVYLVM